MHLHHALALAVTSLSCACRPGRSDAQPSPVEVPQPAWVGVLGTIGPRHLDPEVGYPIGLLYAAMAQARPDVVCGEVEDDHLDLPKRAIAPADTAFVELATRALGARFVASDWRKNPRSTEAALRVLEPDLRRRFDAALDPYRAAEQEVAPEDYFAFIHGPHAQQLLFEGHRLRSALAHEAADGFWRTRTRSIVDACMRQLAGGERVLFVFDVGRKGAIEDVLETRGLTPATIEQPQAPYTEPAPELLERARTRSAQLAAALLELKKSGGLTPGLEARLEGQPRRTQHQAFASASDDVLLGRPSEEEEEEENPALESE